MTAHAANRRMRFVLAAAVALLVALTSATWIAATRRAARQTEAMLDYAMLDLDATINGAIDTMLMHAGDSIVGELGHPSALPTTRVCTIAMQRDLDEVNVVSRDGSILSSSVSRLVGQSMTDTPKSSEFMVLTNGIRHALAHKFRRGAHNPEVRRKYVGVAFPEGDGFVQIGVDETRVTRMFPSIMGFIFDGWLLGEKGFFLCADMGDGHLISNPARHRDEARFLSETGYDPSDPDVVEDGRTTFRQRLFGEICDCRAIVFCGHRVVAALPPSEYYGVRSLFTLIMAFVLAAVLSLFVALLSRIDSDSARIRAFYAAEAAKQTAEFELGRTIQRAALPVDFPSDKFFRIAASMEAAREVGGDFYDFFPIGEKHRAFLVADVSGKGISGALYMMNAKTLVKDALLSEPSHDPAAALVRVNNELCCNNPAEMFVTAWVGVLDLETGVVAFANAGHNPPLRLRAGAAPEWIRERSGCPLGCFSGVKYVRRELTLGSGDALLLYTDGVTEAMDKSGALFGDARLVDTLVAADTCEPRAIDIAVRAAVSSFADGAPRADDITILALQYLPSRARQVKTFPCDESALGASASFLEETLDSGECPVGAKTRLMVALDEVVSNVVRCSGATEVSVEVGFFDEPRGVSVSVSDDGKPFDPLHVPPPDVSLPPEQRKIGGLGLLLVRRTMDDVSYSRTDGRNVLTFRKNFA